VPAARLRSARLDYPITHERRALAHPDSKRASRRHESIWEPSSDRIDPAVHVRSSPQRRQGASARTEPATRLRYLTERKKIKAAGAPPTAQGPVQRTRGLAR